MKTKQPIHLLLRFSDSLLKDKDTIEAHNQVVQQAGAVWFGKMGSTISQQAIDRMNKQVEENIPTFVFLVKGNRRKSTAYRASFIIATKSLPKDDKALIPNYYYELDLIKYMKFWVKLASITQIPFKEMAKLRVASSVLPLSETLNKSSSGHFFLVEKNTSFNST